MGLLEFLLWCEDMGAEPVLGVYAGYSLKGDYVKPGPDLEPFVQEALDEIEYVIGDTNTTWGARRAKDGHPAPFKLHYVEIGNEDCVRQSAATTAATRNFTTPSRANIRSSSESRASASSSRKTTGSTAASPTW